MALVNMKHMLLKAKEEKYAVGQFNINNLEWTKTILAVSEEMNSPVILGVSEGAARYMGGYKTVVGMVKGLIKDQKISVDVAIHLDHGSSFDACKAAIDAGFTSVMIDASQHPLEENIRITKEVVDYAHERGVVVEAELGRLAGIEDAINVSAEDSSYTDPEEAEEFVKRTNVDSLAIAIGTSHGAYKFTGEAKLRFDILEDIQARLPNFPIVLHGASSVIPEYVEMINKYGGKMPGAQGVPEDMLRKAASMAVCKINIDSDLRLALTASIREHFALHPDHFDPRQYLGPGRENIKSIVKHKLVNVLGCDNTAHLYK